MMSRNRRPEMLLRHAHQAECANISRRLSGLLSLISIRIAALMASRLRSVTLLFQLANIVYVDSRHFSSRRQYRARKCHARHRHQARNVSPTLRLSVLSISHSLVDETMSGQAWNRSFPEEYQFTIEASGCFTAPARFLHLLAPILWYAVALS